MSEKKTSEGKDKKQRKYATFFEWPDKGIKELGVVKQLFESMGEVGERRYKNPVLCDNPPDCSAEDNDGNIVAVEVTELVDEDAAKPNKKGLEIYRDWDCNDVVEELESILKEKDMKLNLGKKYNKIVLVIHTDEPVVAQQQYIAKLKKTIFSKSKNIDEAFLILSYAPGSKSYPYVELKFGSV